MQIKLTQSIYLLSCLSLLLVSCNPSPEKVISYEEINEADSLRLVTNLFDSMHQEIYDHWMYEIHRKDIHKYETYYHHRNEVALRIRVNKNGDHMIGKEINGNITSTVYKFYTANQTENDPTNGFPMYSRISMEEINNQIEAARVNLKEWEDSNAPEELIAFKNRSVKEWEGKKKVMETLGTKKLSEIHYPTHIRLEYQENIKKKNELLDSVLLAFYQIRNNSSLKYFKRSYLSLHYEYMETGNQEIAKKLHALRIIHSITLIDIPYCKENNVWIGEVDVPPPPAVETINN